MTSRPPDRGQALPPELDPRGRRPARPAGRSRSRAIATWVSGSLALLVLAVSVLGYGALAHYEGRIQRVDVFQGLSGRPQRAVDTAQNYLLVGSDNREGLSAKEIRDLHLGSPSASNGAGRRSDTMILLHLSKDQDKATLISLPRDSYVAIPAYTDAQGKHHPATHDKLNAAYAWGGPSLTVATVEKATGVRIDHYVEIGFDGFVKMVNAINGVSVCTPKPLDDPKSGLHLKKGTSTLDGSQALAYVRARYVDPTADLGRMQRQQRFLASLFRKALSAQVLLDPIKLNRFLDAVLGSTSMDKGLTRADLIALATRTRGLSPSAVVFGTVPLSDVDYHPGNSPVSYVRWDPVKSAELFKALRDDQPIGSQQTSTGSAATTATVPPAQINVQVLNGGGPAGLAARASNDLQTLGYVIAAPAANADVTDVTTTVIRYDPGYNVSLKTLQAAFPGATTQAVQGLGKVFQVVVGTGYTPPQQVTVKPSAPPSESPVTTTSAADKICTV